MATNHLKRKTFNTSKENKLINECIIPKCSIIFLSDKKDDNKYAAAGIIIENTLKYLVKSRDKDFNLRSSSVSNLIIRANQFHDFPKSFGVFLIKYWNNRNFEVHKKTIVLNERTLNILRNNIYRYLDWFFKKVLRKEIISELKNWKKPHSISTKTKQIKSHAKISKTDKHLSEKLETLKKKSVPLVSETIGKKLILKLKKDEFSRTYYHDVIIDRNQLRGMEVNNPNLLIGLKLDFQFLNGKVSVVNESEKLKILFDNSTLVRKRKKTIPNGNSVLSIAGINLILNCGWY